MTRRSHPLHGLRLAALVAAAAALVRGVAIADSAAPCFESASAVESEDDEPIPQPCALLRARCHPTTFAPEPVETSGELPAAKAAHPAGQPEISARQFTVLDLVGHGNADGTVAEEPERSAPRPYAPGALVRLVREGIDSNGLERPRAAVLLLSGMLTVYADAEGHAYVEGLLANLRSRIDPPMRLRYFDVTTHGSYIADFDVEVCQSPNAPITITASK